MKCEIHACNYVQYLSKVIEHSLIFMSLHLLFQYVPVIAIYVHSVQKAHF